MKNKGNDNLISKYPYLGYSKNIIECFSIIGYEEAMLPQLIEEFKKANNNNIYPPTIISSITSNKDYGLIDNDLIISQIFPYCPKFIKIPNIQNSRNSNILESPRPKNIIYSFMIDSQHSKSKLFYTCYGYIFHEKYKYYDSNNNLFSLEEYYIPKAFCIISQYSFFSFFYYICNNLNIILNNKNKDEHQTVPLEIMIYNIVNFLPSPLNYNLNYNIFNNEVEAPSYDLPQLSGYPYLDFNLSEIFNVLPLNLFLEIYLLSLIEQSILFFGSDLEILNMMMFAIYSLNYPLNNSTYFWHIVSISKNDLNDENRFVGQIMTSLLGVNAAYDDSINTFAFGDYHYIVDIDNKKIIFKESNKIDANTKKDVEKLTNLKTYFQNIIKEKNIESLFLKKSIDQLKKDIENIIKEVQVKNKKEINFFTGDKEKNKIIQEKFYIFILNILIVFYQKINLNVTFDRVRIEQNRKRKANLQEEDEPNYCEEEKSFIELFKSTSKYKIFFENFIQNCESHELYKIPLMLSEEFINLKIKNVQNNIKLNFSLFNIMDMIFSGSGTLNISANNFYHHYIEEKCKIYFIDDDNNIDNYNNNSAQQNDNNAIAANNDSKLFCFNRNFLQKYIYLLNNHYESEKLNEIFPYLKIKKEPIHLIERKIISQTIMNALEKNNLIKTSNYLIYSLLYVFSILMSLYSYKNLLYYIDKILVCINKLDFFLRFYIIIIMQTFYNYYLKNKENGNYNQMKFTNIKIYYYLFLSHLKEQKILPNEEMFLLLKKVFGKNIFKERGSLKEKNYSNIEMELVDYKQQDIELDLKDSNVFQIFLKYNFGYKGFYKSKLLIRSAMKETGNYNVSFKDDFIKTGKNEKNEKNEKKKKTLVVVVKVKDEVYSSELFTPKKVFKLSQIAYKDFITNSNLDLENINIKRLREILVNLIQYSIEINELNIPYDFLLYGLYLTKNLNENFRIMPKNSIYINNAVKIQ